MCDVCALAAEAKARHGSRLRTGARERLARQAINSARAEDAETTPDPAASGLRGLVALEAGRWLLAALRTRTQPTR